ncbi:MAG: DinB family protein [Candidatus Acidiferrales bacterium]
MNLEDVRQLYDFNAWANKRTIDSCAALSPEQFTRDLGSSFKSVRDTLAHIHGAQWIWLERWHGRTPSGLPSAADFPDFETVRQRFAEIDRNLVDYAASLTAEDLHRVISLKTSSGGVYAQPLWQMLQHLANHGTYHRGQIATMLRQLGCKPTSTDLIGFYRERIAKATV